MPVIHQRMRRRIEPTEKCPPREQMSGGKVLGQPIQVQVKCLLWAALRTTLSESLKRDNRFHCSTHFSRQALPRWPSFWQNMRSCQRRRQ